MMPLRVFPEGKKTALLCGVAIALGSIAIL
jgi:hypothetical protein